MESDWVSSIFVYRLIFCSQKVLSKDPPMLFWFCNWGIWADSWEVPSTCYVLVEIITACHSGKREPSECQEFNTHTWLLAMPAGSDGGQRPITYGMTLDNHCLRLEMLTATKVVAAMIWMTSLDSNKLAFLVCLLAFQCFPGLWYPLYGGVF